MYFVDVFLLFTQIKSSKCCLVEQNFFSKQFLHLMEEAADLINEILAKQKSL